MNNAMGTVFNIQKFCLHDGKGIRTVVFLKGCPLRCIWCHNPESRNTEPELMKKGEESVICGKNMTADEVIAEVLKDKHYYEESGGGMTISGGEPAMQPDFTLELIRLAKTYNIDTAIETCGYGSNEFFRQAFESCVTFLYDIKCLDNKKHKEYCGKGNEDILSNLNYLMDNKANIVIRLPLIPGLNDTDDDLKALSDFLNEHIGRYEYAEIMPYHNLGIGKMKSLGRNPVYEADNASEEDIERWKDYFRKNNTDIRVSE